MQHGPLHAGLSVLPRQCLSSKAERAGRQCTRVIPAMRSVLFDNGPLEVPEWCPASTGFFVIFFDGGLCGKLGPGGSDSAVLRVNTHQRQTLIVWAASMSYGCPQDDKQSGRIPRTNPYAAALQIAQPPAARGRGRQFYHFAAASVAPAAASTATCSSLPADASPC